MKNLNWKEHGLDLLADLVGSFIFAISLQSFNAPNQIAPGGVSGLAVVLEYLTGLSIGTWSLLINIPLLATGWWILGRHFTIRTMITVVIMSAITDFAGLFLPIYTGDALLASIFGGVLMGTGLGLIFMRGSTTGGTDIVSRLLLKWFPHMQMGRVLLMIDVVTILFSAAVFQQIETALYGTVSAFLAGKVIDTLLYGMETGKLVYIISPQSIPISLQLMDELGRGCTLVKAEGGYKRQDIQMLLIAVHRQQYYRLKRIVHDFDPNAFIIVTDSTEVLGEGFKPITKDV
ncbi:MAG: YitT family protein [Anaerotruncus sp.]|nr:YitT family protein [Anaerotruncus sp.]